MENIGSLAILLAFCFAVYSVLASVAGRLTKRPLLVLSASRAVYCVWGLLTVAAGLLVYSLITGDFRLAYVATHSNKSMATAYKFASWWGGQEGSLLLWAWLLSTYSAVVVFQNRRKFRDMMPYVTAVLMTTETFFLILIAFVEQPFRVLMAGKGIVDVGDGQGAEPTAAVLDDGDSPADALLGLRRIRRAVCVRDWIAEIGSLITKQRAKRGSHDAALDPGDVDVPNYWNSARRGLGIWRCSAGAAIGLGSGRERLAAAVDHGHRFSALCDDAGKKGH